MSLVANLGLVVALVIVGVLVYKESLTFRQVIGMGICVIGLILISK